jgi:hypothetical protein
MKEQGLLALTGPLDTSRANGKKAVAGVKTTYAPISSVWEGTDGELLEAMFSFYAAIEPEPFLTLHTTQAACGKVLPVALSQWT